MKWHAPHPPRVGVSSVTRARAMPLRLQKKASRIARAVVEEFNVARGVGARTDKRGNAKTSLWDHGKVRRGKTVDRWMRGVRASGW